MPYSKYLRFIHEINHFSCFWASLGIRTKKCCFWGIVRVSLSPLGYFVKIMRHYCACRSSQQQPAVQPAVQQQPAAAACRNSSSSSSSSSNDDYSLSSLQIPDWRISQLNDLTLQHGRLMVRRAIKSW